MMSFDDHQCRHQAATVIEVFNELFTHRYQTRLEGGGEEPLYQPMTGSDNPVHKITFTRDYFASALHEVAHWCIAGAERRLLEDYGYWYAPDGRTAAQQAEFERVEVKPQALEWIFSQAASYRFRLSSDNLNGGLSHSEQFRRAVWEQARRYCEQGLPSRANQFAQGLAKAYGIGDYLDPSRYRLEDI